MMINILKQMVFLISSMGFLYLFRDRMTEQHGHRIDIIHLKMIM